MTASRGAFHTYTRLRAGDRRTVAVASGEALKISGIGTIQLSMPSEEGEPETLTLRNALHVPGLAVNLVSVPALQLEQTDVLFTSEGATIFTKHHELYAHLDPERKASMIMGQAHTVREQVAGSHPQPLERPIEDSGVGNGGGLGVSAGVDGAGNGGGTRLSAGVSASIDDVVDRTIGDGYERGSLVGTDLGGSGRERRLFPDTEPGAEVWADGPPLSGTTTQTGSTATGKHKAVHFQKQVPVGLSGKILLWHRRLGHPGLEPFAKFARNGEIVGLSESQVRSLGRTGQLCNTCVETKLARIRFGKSKRRSKRRLGLVHVDLVGPFIDVGGYQYFLTSVDDYSRRNWVIPLQTKAAAFSELKTLLTRLERETGVKVQAIRSDNGGEFTSNEVKQWTREQGIAWQYTTPYSSVQSESPNG